MKTTITYMVGCLAILILLGSCNSNNVLLKRHYMKGYYFSHADKKSDVAVNTKKSESSVVHHSPVTSLVAPVVRNDKAASLSASAAITQKVSATNAHQPFKKLLANKPLRKIYSLNPVSLGKEMKKSALKPLVRDDSGLSLFWVVILILLILWAIGWLTGGFGLGNLIHLLLVAALVLLILWLLHII